MCLGCSTATTTSGPGRLHAVAMGPTLVGVGSIGLGCLSDACRSVQGHKQKSSVGHETSAVGGEADENRAEADIMRQRSPCALSPICRADALAGVGPPITPLPPGGVSIAPALALCRRDGTRPVLSWVTWPVESRTSAVVIRFDSVLPSGTPRRASLRLGPPLTCPSQDARKISI